MFANWISSKPTTKVQNHHKYIEIIIWIFNQNKKVSTSFHVLSIEILKNLKLEAKLQ